MTATSPGLDSLLAVRNLSIMVNVARLRHPHDGVNEQIRAKIKPQVAVGTSLENS